jgi:hypothetical protein
MLQCNELQGDGPCNITATGSRGTGVDPDAAGWIAPASVALVSGWSDALFIVNP